MMFGKIFFVFLFAFFVPLKGVSQVIKLDSTFSSIEIIERSLFLNDSLIYPDISRTKPFKEKDWRKSPKNGIIKTSNKFGYWMKFVVECRHSGDYVLENSFVSINKFYVYLEEENGQIENIGFTDFKRNTNFNKLNYRKPSFSVYLEKDKKYQFFIFGHYGGSSTNIFQLKLWESESFIKNIVIDHLYYGLFFGFLLFLSLLSLITYYFFRTRIYVFFALHTLNQCLFYLFVSGIGLTYFWDKFLQIQGYGVLTSGLLSVLFFSALAMDLLKVKERSKTYYKIFRSLNFYFSAYFLLLIIKLVYVDINIIFYKVFNFTVIIFPVFIFLVCLKIYRLTKDRTALYLLIIFQITLVSFILFPFIPSGIIPRKVLEYYKWFFVIESLFLWILIIRSFYKEKQEKIDIQDQLIEQKNISAINFIEGEDNERKRLSRQLHDSISVQLASLKIITKDNKLSKEIDHISSEIRQISHALNPITLTQLGLVSAIDEEIFKHEDLYPDITIKFNANQSNTLKIKPLYQKMIYWTFLELLNNTIKHANADFINIKLSITSGLILFDFEDNGNGYNYHNIDNSGIGIRNIIDRSKLIHGTFEIISLTKGVLHRFSIPLD